MQAMAQMQAAQLRQHNYPGSDSGSEGFSTDEEQFMGKEMSPALPPSIRAGFVRKVYTILSVMLIVTTIIAAPFQMLSIYQLQQYGGLIYGLMMGSLVITLAMTCCCMGAMRSYPANYLFLAVFSVLYGIIVGAISATYTLPSVMLAAGLTAAIFIMLTIFACTTKHDFTGCGPYLAVALFGLIGFGLMAMIVGFFSPGLFSVLNMIYAAVGAIFFSFYIVYDTQMIVGGKKHQLSVDDYAFGALMLYLDIINLFLMILSLFGDRK